MTILNIALLINASAHLIRALATLISVKRK
jgi:hypothetical protein